MPGLTFFRSIISQRHQDRNDNAKLSENSVFQRNKKNSIYLRWPELINAYIDSSVGVHSCRSCVEKNGFLPQTTDIVEPPRMLVRTACHRVVRQQLVRYLCSFFSRCTRVPTVNIAQLIHNTALNYCILTYGISKLY